MVHGRTSQCLDVADVSAGNLIMLCQWSITLIGSTVSGEISGGLYPCAQLEKGNCGLDEYAESALLRWGIVI